MSYDISFSRYNYPNANQNSFNELNAYLNYYAITGHIAYSNDEYATGKNGSYYNLGFNVPVPSSYAFNLNDVHFSGGIGYSLFSSRIDLHHYLDFNLTLTKIIDLYTIALQWTDTNGQSTDLRALKGNMVSLMVARKF